MKFFFLMKRILPLIVLLFSFGISLAQTKVSGRVFDDSGEPVAYASVVFKGSIEGTTTDENGRFYLESNKTWKTLVISFLGYDFLSFLAEGQLEILTILERKFSSLNCLHFRCNTQLRFCCGRYPLNKTLLIYSSQPQTLLAVI